MAEIQTASTQADPKSTASNIANGINDKANGKAPVGEPNGKQPVTAVDPNAGKERFVVDGREVWLTPEQSKAYTQKGLAFEPRMDQLARLQQETAQLQRALLQNPGKVLENLAKANNVPLESLVQNVLKGTASDSIKEAVGKWYYEDVIEPMKMTEEQKKARENEKWRQERESRDKMSADDAIRQENKRKADIAGQQLLGFVREAMKESGLPDINTPLGTLMARRTLELSHVAAKNGQSVTPKQAIEKVKLEMKEFNSMWLDNLDEETLVKELGEKNAEKVKKYFLKLAKDANGKIPSSQNGRPTPKGERKVTSLDDFHDYLDELKKQG